MELEGANRAFKFLQDAGLKINVLMSARHKGIAKWIQTQQKGKEHYNDIWQVNKRMVENLPQSSVFMCSIHCSWV